VRCSDAREALSARYDGEAPPVDESALRAHVLGCAGCAAFEAALTPADRIVREATAKPAPELAGRIVVTAARRAGRRRTSLRSALRLSVAALGVAELVLALAEMLGSHDHESHESSSFTVALCVALVYAALRPRLARGYVPVLASASALLLVTSVEDVDHGTIGLAHELPHLGILLGTLLLWLLALEDSGGPTLQLRRIRRRRPPHPPRLHAVVRACARTVGQAVAVGSLTAIMSASSLVLLAGPASAHAVLEASDPRPDAVLAALPGSVTLTFDEPVTLVPGSLRVYDPDGQRIDRGDVDHPGDAGAKVGVGLRAGQARGSYLVSWRVVSADSHPVSGAFTFAVGAAGDAPPTPEDASSTAISATLAVARWVGYAGSALLVGTLLVVAWCWAEGWRQRRVRSLARVGGALLMVGAVADLLLKGPYDAALGLDSVTDGALLREVLDSTYGHATLARLVLVALGLAALGRWRPTRLAATLFAVAMGLSFAFAGHAAAGNGRVLALINDTVHVVAASAWLGGLLLVLVAVESAVVVRRFSRVAAGAVLLLLATGLWQAARHVGSWAALRHTTYGHELLVKLLVLALVLALAAGARALVWRSESGQPARIRMVVLGETLGLAVVLGISSALVATEPANTAYHPTATGELMLVGETVQVSAVPAGDRQMDLHVYLFDADGQPSDPKEVTASVSLPSKQLGPLPVALAVAGPGHRQGALAVPVTGEWRLAVTVRTTAIDQATGYVTLPIR
jgi:copper transport protein